LGFERGELWGDPPNFAMPHRGPAVVMLHEKELSKVRHNQGVWDAFFWIEDASKLFKECESGGAAVVYPPEYKDQYDCLEFALRDPDGYTLAFGQLSPGDGNDQSAKKASADQRTTKFLYLSPVLASENVARDVAWYELQLGFKNVYDSTQYQDRPIDYAVVGRQDLYVHLQFQYPKDMISTDVRIQVENIKPLITELSAKGLITPDKVREKTNWNTKEFSLKDPSRNRITFFEDL
jgi:hypothetical protein